MKHLLEVQRIADIGVVGTGTAALRIAAMLAQSLGRFGVGITVAGSSNEAAESAVAMMPSSEFLRRSGDDGGAIKFFGFHDELVFRLVEFDDLNLPFLCWC